MHVLIVGGGIMGLSAAWACRRRGHEVALLEQGPLPNPLAASSDQYRVIHFNHRRAADARDVAGAHEAWDRVWDDIDAWHYLETGCFAVSGEPGDGAEQSLAVLNGIGQACEQLSPRQAAGRFPCLNLEGARWAYQADHGGVLLAGRILESLAAWAVASNVVIHTDTRVRSVAPDRAEVRCADGASYSADVLVMAAGPWTGRLLPDFAGRLLPAQRLVAYLDPPAEWKKFWQFAPLMLELANDAGIHIVPPVAGLPLRIADRDLTAGDPDRDRTPDAEAVAALLNAAGTRVRDIASYTLRAAWIGVTTMPGDRAFLLEQSEKAWIMADLAEHGFMFAPMLAEAVADTIDGTRDAGEVVAWAAGDGAG